MNTIIINEDKLNNNDIEVVSNKVRAILVDDHKLLIANYGGVYLLPGGSIENGESKDNAIIRELKEEIGIDYSINELESILTLNYYQKHYPVRHGNFKNRLSITNFYLGNYRGIDLCKINRTAKEIRDGFSLRLVDYDNLDMLISENSSNPRKLFFDRELSELQKVLSKTF